MFRKMRRFKQQLSDEECIAVLRSETRGVLSMLGDDGYPYGVPMNHWYYELMGNYIFTAQKKDIKSMRFKNAVRFVILFLIKVTVTKTNGR